MEAAATAEPEFLTADEVLARWRGKISAKTLSNWRRDQGIGLPFTRLGNQIVYPLASLKEWERGRTFLSTQDYGKKPPPQA
jgi:hypothetical protein